MTPYLIAFLGTTLFSLFLVVHARARLVLAFACITVALAAPLLSDLIVKRAEGEVFTRISEVADVR